jgi:hypothetical protein
MKKYSIIFFCLGSFACYGQNKPDFLKRYSDWRITNSKDSSKILTLDTLKLTIYGSLIGRLQLSFDFYSDSLEFLTNCGVDTVGQKEGEMRPVLCVVFRSGRREYDSRKNTLKLIINDKKYPILNYLVQEVDEDHVLLIKYNPK